jgi:predicted ATPase
MSLISKKSKTKVLLDDVLKFDQVELEFLHKLIQSSMIPGKYLTQAVSVLSKIRNMYQVAGMGDTIDVTVEDDK